MATVAVQAGLEIAFDGTVAMAGDTPSGRVKLALALPRPLAGAGGRPRDNVQLDDFFDGAGYSLVAGRAALVRAGTVPERAATAALAAGAAAVVLYGGRLPAGALELEDAAGVPVVGIPEPAGLAVASRLREGSAATVAIASQGRAAVGGGVAPFSSRGLAFDGRLKPDLVAAGVGLRTAEPGETESGEALFGSISGASAAAAVAGGAAALLAEARPDLQAAELRGALVGAARPLVADSRSRPRGPGCWTSGPPPRPSSSPSRPRSPSGRTPRRAGSSAGASRSGTSRVECCGRGCGRGSTPGRLR